MHVWSSEGGYSTPEVALASQPSVVPSLPSVLDLAGYSSEQSLPQSLHGHGPSPFIVGPGYATISAKSVKVPMQRKFQSIANGMKVTFEQVSFDVESFKGIS